MPEILNFVDDAEIVIPAWVTDNASFLRWAESADAPAKGRYGFLQNQLWIDQTMETVLHNLIKAAVYTTVGAWVEQQELGYFHPDGMLLSVPELEFSTQPDGMFVSHESWQKKRVKTSEQGTGSVLYGAPDMVLEVVSRSSKRKDLITLRELYWEAGIAEYWVIDRKGEEHVLAILRRTSRGYQVTPTQSGWVRSPVLGASFRLVVTESNNRYRVRLNRKQQQS
jgi:Uma2 family endonuclease